MFIMASTSHTVEDTLITAQRALAVHYGNSYPCSNRVQQSLREILNQKFNGSHRSFTEKFLRPTTLLLEKLKAEGFPLVKDGRVILHLSGPINHLEVGEMFFQVGHTTPGTLTLKFAKPSGNTVFLQPSIVEEIEYHLAFTQQYLHQLRKEAGTSGDNLMQLLVISTVNGQDCATEKIRVDGIMPYRFGHGRSKTPSSKIDQSVGDGSPSYRQREENSDQHPVEHSLGDRENSQRCPLADESANLLNTDQKLKEQPSDPLTGNNIVYPNTRQTAHNLPLSSGSERLQQECSSAVCDYNPAYPPISQAARDQNIQECADLKPQKEQFSVRNNPPHHPIHQAVKDQPNPDESVRLPKEGQSSDARKGKISNTSYTQAVRDQLILTNINTQSPPETSSGTGANNPSYPPIYQAVKDPTALNYNDTRIQQEHVLGAEGGNPPEDKGQQSLKERPSPDGGEKNPPYPSIHRAVSHQNTSDTGAKELSSGARVKNPPYPPIHRAVRDQTTPKDTGQRLLKENSSSSGEEKNPSYPSIHQAVSDQCTPKTDQQEDSSNIGTNNPQYPPIHQAVRDQPTPEDTGQLIFREYPSSGGEEKNPSYPSIHQAVSDQRTPDTGQQEDSSATVTNNPKYPPIHQAVRDQHTPEDIGQRLFKGDPPSGGEKNNPSYPSIHLAVCDERTPDTGQQEDLSTTGTNNPKYPPIHQAVRDQHTPEDIGQRLFKGDPPSGGEENNPSYPSIHQAVSDQRTPDTGQQEDSSATGTNNPKYPPVHQAVRDHQHTPEDIGQRLFKRDPPSGGGENNPSYPSIHQAVSDQRTPDTGQQEDLLATGTNNPKYPPIHQAVRDQHTPEDIGQRLFKGDPPSGGKYNNPSYPSIHQAVSDQRTPNAGQQEDSSATGTNNPKYPPIHQVVRDQHTPEDIGQRLFKGDPPSGGKCNNPSYPSIHQAVSDQRTPNAGQQEDSSATGTNNPKYPPIHQAVRDQHTPEDIGQRLFKGDPPSGGGENNPSYPSIHQAVSDQRTPNTGQQEDSSATGTNNPKYPPIHQAVRDHHTPEDIGQRLFRGDPPSGGEENNPSYPSIHQAVSDQRTPDTGQQEDSSATSTNNPKYPPIHQSVRDQHTPEEIGQRLFKEDPPSGGGENNPSYPSIHQAVCDQRTPDTGQQEDSSGTDKNNPQYPPVHQAVRDQPTPENIGQLLFEEEPPSGREEKNPSYPSLHQAVGDQRLPDTSQQESSSTGTNNPQYPPVHQAVRDQFTPEDIGQQLFKEEPPSDGAERNPSYPLIHQAISDQHTTHDQQEHSLRAGGNNPQYPPIHRAVRDQPTTEDVDQRPPRTEQSSDGGEKNPTYPSIHHAVDDRSELHAGHLRNSPGVGANNPPYPPIHQAVSDQPPDSRDHEHSSNASEADTSQRVTRGQNITENTGRQNTGAQVIDAVGNNPTYLPPKAVAVGNNSAYLPPQAERYTAKGCPTKSEQVSSDAGRSDSPRCNSRNSTTSIAIADPYRFLEDEECQF